MPPQALWACPCLFCDSLSAIRARHTRALCRFPVMRTRYLPWGVFWACCVFLSCGRFSGVGVCLAGAPLSPAALTSGRLPADGGRRCQPVWCCLLMRRRQYNCHTPDRRYIVRSVKREERGSGRFSTLVPRASTKLAKNVVNCCLMNPIHY